MQRGIAAGRLEIDTDEVTVKQAGQRPGVAGHGRAHRVAGRHQANPTADDTG